MQNAESGTSVIVGLDLFLSNLAKFLSYSPLPHPTWVLSLLVP